MGIGLFLIQALGILTTIMLLVFVAKLIFKFLPGDVKKAIFRSRICDNWDDILDELSSKSYVWVRIATAHRQISSEAMDNLSIYVRECLSEQTRTAFEDIELGNELYVSGVSHQSQGDVLILTIDVRRGDKKYIVKPTFFNKGSEILIPL